AIFHQLFPKGLDGLRRSKEFRAFLARIAGSTAPERILRALAGNALEGKAWQLGHAGDGPPDDLQGFRTLDGEPATVFQIDNRNPRGRILAEPFHVLLTGGAVDHDKE